MVNDLIFIADGRPMEQNAGGYWNKGLEWFTSKAFIVHNAVIDEIDKSCFFSTCYMYVGWSTLNSKFT